MDGLEKRVVTKEENIKGIKGTEESYYSPSQRDSSGAAYLACWFIPLGVGIYVSMHDELPSKIFGGLLVAAGIGGLIVEDYIQPINFIKSVVKMACSLARYPYDKLKKHM